LPAPDASQEHLDMLISAVLPVVLRQQAQSPAQPRGYVALFQSTGFVGMLLLLLGVVALVLAIRRWLALRPERLAPAALQRSLESALRAGQSAASLKQAAASHTCLGEVVTAGLYLQSVGLDEMLANVERTAIKESLRHANGIANIARFGLVVLLVGVLGTVMGLVSTMSVLGMLKSPQISDLVDGVGESLTCTAIGLAIALFSFVAYFALESRLVHRTLAVREIAEELMRTAVGIDNASTDRK
jgi:biopolymer transport protein ExbB